MPAAFYRLLALPNGIAMIALGYSLWREQRTAPMQSVPGIAAHTLPDAAGGTSFVRP